MMKRVILLWLGIWLLLAGLWWAAKSPWVRLLTDPELAASVARYVEVADLVRDGYVEPDKATWRKLTEAALHGMPAVLDDYCEYYDEPEFEEFQKGSRNVILGLGVRMSEIDADPVVVRVFPGSPAWEAGVRPGDRLLRVGGQTVSGRGVEASHKALAEAGDKPVELLWKRPSTGEERVRTMARRELTAPTVHSFPLGPDKIAYVELSHFCDRTPAELSAELRELETEGAGGLVLDLRGNPGGLLEAAVRVAGIFLPEGKKVLSVQGRPGESDEVRFTEDSAYRWKHGLVIVMDGDSASASEVLAACLQDHGRAQVVGGRSFGKGSVQTVIPLAGGGGLRMTIAHYTSPKGRVIQGKGVQPDLICDKAGAATLLEREAWAWKPGEGNLVFGTTLSRDPVIEQARTLLLTHRVSQKSDATLIENSR